MKNELFSFFLTLISGLSTLLGFLVIFIKKDEKSIISSSLYLAAGVMISVSFLDLIPNSYKYINNYYFIIFTIILILFYFILGISISKFINLNISKKDNIYKVGIITMLTIMVHNIPEGMVTYLTSSNDINLGLNLALAIALHNIPEGISIAIPIYYSTKNKRKAFLYTLISALAEPIGAIIGYLFLKDLSILYLGYLFSIIAGIMINISFTELLPTAIKIKSNTFYYFILGVIVIILSLIY